MDPQRRTFLAGLAGAAAAGAAWGCGKSMSDSPNSSDSANGNEPTVTPAVSAREADRNAATDELFADLSDQSGSVAPISPAEHAAPSPFMPSLSVNSTLAASTACLGSQSMSRTLSTRRNG